MTLGKSVNSFLERLSDAFVSKVTSLASYIGGALSVVSALTLTDWGILIGILTAIVTCGINAYYKHRRYLLDKEMNEWIYNDRRHQEVQVLYERRKVANEE